MFITIEGIEGSGKSTLLTGLAQRLRDQGRPLFVTREPGGTPVGDAIRRIFLDDPNLSIAPLTEALLINASRAQHVLDAIRPALERGEIVLCDRYTDSTLAYQGYGRGYDLACLRELCDAATNGLAPDLTFILDVPVSVSEERLVSRAGSADRMELQDRAFHERVRNGFLTLAQLAPRYHVLDGRRDPSDLVGAAMRVLAERVA
jgi:dTMP kinase